MVDVGSQSADTRFTEMHLRRSTCGKAIAHAKLGPINCSGENEVSGLFKTVLGWFSNPSATGDRESKPASGKPEVYKDYIITSESVSEGGQFRLAGRVVSKLSGKEHYFIRADLFTSRADADHAAILKGQRLVDEQGDRMFG